MAEKAIIHVRNVGVAFTYPITASSVNTSCNLLLI